MYFKLIAASALAGLCSACSNTQVTGVGASTASLVFTYDSLADLINSGNTAANIAKARLQTPSSVLALLVRNVDDAAFVIGGVSFSGLGQALRNHQTEILDFYGSYRTMGQYWDGLDYDPSKPLNAAQIEAFATESRTALQGSKGLGLGACMSSQCSTPGVQRNAQGEVVGSGGQVVRTFVTDSLGNTFAVNFDDYQSLYSGKGYQFNVDALSMLRGYWKTDKASESAETGQSTQKPAAETNKNSGSEETSPRGKPPAYQPEPDEFDPSEMEW